MRFTVLLKHAKIPYVTLSYPENDARKNDPEKDQKTPKNDPKTIDFQVVEIDLTTWGSPDKSLSETDRWNKRRETSRENH